MRLLEAGLTRGIEGWRENMSGEHTILNVMSFICYCDVLVVLVALAFASSDRFGHDAPIQY